MVEGLSFQIINYFKYFGRHIRTIDPDLVSDHPIWGAALSFPDARNPGSYRVWELSLLREMRKRYPTEPIFKIFLGITPMLFIATAEGAESLLKNNNFNRKGAFYQCMIPWLGEGILISEGAKE